MNSLHHLSSFHLAVYSPSDVVRKLLTHAFQHLLGTRVVAFEKIEDLYKADISFQGGVLDEIKEAKFDFPLLFLTSPGSFQKGLSKPFLFHKLIDAACHTFGFHQVNLGPYLFNPYQRLLKKEDQSFLVLREKEAEILWCLFKSPSHYATRSDLLLKLWGYQKEIETHTLETHIYHLRQKIERDPANPCLLITLQGGYQLVLD